MSSPRKLAGLLLGAVVASAVVLALTWLAGRSAAGRLWMIRVQNDTSPT